MKILKCLLMIVTAPVILVLTLFVWLCMGLIYISGLVLGLLSTVIALLGVAVLITYSPQNGAILLIMAFLISPDISMKWQPAIIPTGRTVLPSIGLQCAITF